MMQVIQISLSNRAGREEKFVGPATFHDAIRHLAYGDLYTRAAFVGRMPLGRAGVALELYDGEVLGHKIDPIPAQLIDRVEHFPILEARDAFRAFAHSRNILIGNPENGILLQWNGFLEVYGAGNDSMAPP